MDALTVFLSGLAYAWLFTRFGRWPAVIAHTLYNGLYLLGHITTPLQAWALLAALTAPLLFTAAVRRVRRLESIEILDRPTVDNTTNRVDR